MREVTQEDAILIANNLFIFQILDSPTQVDFLERTNPELLTAYENLCALARGDD